MLIDEIFRRMCLVCLDVRVLIWCGCVCLCVCARAFVVCPITISHLLSHRPIRKSYSTNYSDLQNISYVQHWQSFGRLTNPLLLPNPNSSAPQASSHPTEGREETTDHIPRSFCLCFSLADLSHLLIIIVIGMVCEDFLQFSIVDLVPPNG